MVRNSGTVDRPTGHSLWGTLVLGVVAVLVLTALVSSTVVGVLYLLARTPLGDWLQTL